MQGIIYTVLSDLVIEKFGALFWDQMLEDLKPSSQGIYTAGEQYSDDELLAMVAYLSEQKNIPTDDLVRLYGQYLFSRLYNSLPESYPNKNNLLEFLISVDQVIHKEVKRLYPDAYLPQFQCKSEGDRLTMYYTSKRKLCAAAEGLIIGASEQFGEEVEIEQPQCMHHGASFCEIVVTFKGKHE